jgi:hypothetical protein
MAITRPEIPALVHQKALKCNVIFTVFVLPLFI